MIRQNSDSYHDFFKLVSKFTLSRIKILSKAGKQINTASLADALSSCREAQSLIEQKINEAIVSFSSQHTPSVFSSQIKQLKLEKESLARDLDELESRLEKKDRFFKTALLLMANLSSNSANMAFRHQIDLFKKLIKRNADDQALEKALNQLRDRALSEVFDEGQNASPQSLENGGNGVKKLGFFFKKKKQPIVENDAPDEQFGLDLLKASYQDFIQCLRMTLGEAYLDRLSRLNRRIEGIASIENIAEIRNDVISLLRMFIDSVSAEREAEAAAIIHEISRQISEMESFLSDSLDHVGATKQSNTEFNIRMVAELRELNQNATGSQTLEELKTAVVTKLAHIKTVLENKSREDELRNAGIAQKIERLRQGVRHMKKEADAANLKVGKLKEQLLLDPLTGAFNRKAYNERIRNEFERYMRYHRVFSLLLFDIDHFKSVNDQHGHAIGDKCLQEITRRTKELIRQNDLLFRIGGEEFVIILPETDGSGARQVADKLRCAVENMEFILKNTTLKITVSIGLSTVRPEDKEVPALFDRVDAAMYAAKKNGRNRVVLK